MLEGEMRDLNKSRKESFGALDSREKTIAILGDISWPQTAKQDGDEICRFLCRVWKKRNEYLNVEVSLLGVGTVLRLERENVIIGQSTK